MEAEQEALADQALNEFAAAYGLEVPAPEAAEGGLEATGQDETAPTQEAPTKDMGPKLTEE